MWWTCYRLKREFGRRVETFTNQKRVPSLPSKSALESNLLKLNSTCFLHTPFLFLSMYLFTMFIKTWILLCWSKLLNLEFLYFLKYKTSLPQARTYPSIGKLLGLLENMIINWKMPPSLVGSVSLLAFFFPHLSLNWALFLLWKMLHTLCSISFL